MHLLQKANNHQLLSSFGKMLHPKMSHLNHWMIYVKLTVHECHGLWNEGSMVTVTLSCFTHFSVHLVISIQTLRNEDRTRNMVTNRTSWTQNVGLSHYIHWDLASLTFWKPLSKYPLNNTRQSSKKCCPVAPLFIRTFNKLAKRECPLGEPRRGSTCARMNPGAW